MLRAFYFSTPFIPLDNFVTKSYPPSQTMWDTPRNVRSRESQPPFPRRRNRHAFCQQLLSSARSPWTANIGILNGRAQRAQRKTAANEKLPMTVQTGLPLTAGHQPLIPPSFSSALSCLNNSTRLFSIGYNNLSLFAPNWNGNAALTIF